MDVKKIQKKLIDRISSPAEWIYVVCSHWILIGVLLFVGAAIAFAHVTSEQPMYSAQATLRLSARDPLLDSGRRGKFSGKEYVRDQLGIIQSDVVLLGVVQRLGFANIIAEENEPVDSARLGDIQKIYRKLAEKAKGVLGRLSVARGGSLEEQQEQEALALFRARVNAGSTRGGNQVRMSIYGSDRENLEDQLNVWIKFYQSFVLALANNRDVFLDVRKQRCQTKIRSSEQALRRFKEENSAVSPITKQILSARVVRLQARVDQLKDPMLMMSGFSGGRPADVLAGDSIQNSFLAELKDLLRSANKDLFLLRGRAGRDSRVVADKVDEIRSLGDQIALFESLGGDGLAGFDEAGLDLDVVDPAVLDTANLHPIPEDEEAVDSPIAVHHPARSMAARAEQASRQREAMLSDLAVELDRAISRLIDLEGRLETLAALLTSHRKALAKLEELESLSELSEEWKAKEQIVKIDMISPPRAGVSAINGGLEVVVKNVAAGGIFGGGLGLILAFCAEFFCRRIRFKSDVVNDVELGVVGVIPEK